MSSILKSFQTFTIVCWVQKFFHNAATSYFACQVVQTISGRYLMKRQMEKLKVIFNKSEWPKLIEKENSSKSIEFFFFSFVNASYWHSLKERYPTQDDARYRVLVLIWMRKKWIHVFLTDLKLDDAFENYCCMDSNFHEESETENKNKTSEQLFTSFENTAWHEFPLHNKYELRMWWIIVKISLLILAENMKTLIGTVGSADEFSFCNSSAPNEKKMIANKWRSAESYK